MISMTDYNPEWPRQFAELAVVLRHHLGRLDIDIQHVGSTSVPGLAAKPILDIDLIVPDPQTSHRAIGLLAGLGYIHRGDLGVPGREAFRRESAGVPHTPESRGWPEHNLYLCLRGCPSVENHLQLREYLRAHPVEAAEYAALKRSLAVRHADDMDGYVEGKSAFIGHILKAVGFEAAEIDRIKGQNRRPDPD